MRSIFYKNNSDLAILKHKIARSFGILAVSAIYQPFNGVRKNQLFGIFLFTFHLSFSFP